MTKVIGIIGLRRRDSLKDFHKVKTAFQDVFKEGDTIVSGGCPQGGDRFAELLAIELLYPHVYEDGQLLGFPAHTRSHLLHSAPSLLNPITIHHADWARYGKRAGFHRNTFIAEDADLLIACVAHDRKGGTEDTITKFLAMDGNGKEKVILV